MSTIQVKPHPDLDSAAWPLIVHPVSGSLLNADKKVPDDGRPWLNDGFTARMLVDSAIIRGDHPAFATKKPDTTPPDGSDTPPRDKSASEPDPAH